MRREAHAPAPWTLLASLLTVGTMLTLFVARPLDDNRLTSWQWVFAPADGGRLALWLVLAVLLAHLAGALPWRRLRLVPLLAAGAFGVTTLLWPTPEVILDAARHFGQAKGIGMHGAASLLQSWGAAIPAWTDLPLIPVLYGSLFVVLGEERLYLQAFNSGLFAGTVLLTWQIGRTLWQEELGLTAAALLLGMPFLLVQVPLTLADVPTMFFLTLATFATLIALRRGGWLRVALAAAAIALAVFSKYSAWLMLTVLPVLALAEARGRAPEVGRRAAAIAGGALLLVVPVLLSMSELVGAQLALLHEFQAPALGRWSESSVSTFLFQSHPFIAFAAVASLWLAWRARDGRFAVVAWLPLLMLILGVRRARYLVPVMPMLALMAAYGLQAIRRAALRGHIVRCVVASSLVIVFCGFLPFLQRNSAANLQTAGAYLDSLDDEAVEVVALPQRGARVNPAIVVPLLDLHTAKRLVADAARLPSPPEVARLPLRFTWEYRHPPFYGEAGQTAKALPVAVVAGERAADLPPSLAQRLARHRLTREFAVSEQVFGYQTLVSVYLPESSHGR
ncbi:MAG: hypothetical protein EPO27_03760 [Betaproteobacteria bacterium]|nr:MAG: hypothetical protein EPO27_03760 [Betaproteobacteria bacterium]